MSSPTKKSAPRCQIQTAVIVNQPQMLVLIGYMTARNGAMLMEDGINGEPGSFLLDVPESQAAANKAIRKMLQAMTGILMATGY